MSAKRWKAVMGACMAMVLARATLAQTVVYDNTTTYTGTELFATLSAGNEITLAGTARIVTGIDVFFRVAGDGPATFDAEVRFRKNDLDIGGMLRPGTQLWFSGRVPLAIDSGAPVSVHFDVPSVDVPDTFTCTIWLTNQQGNMSELGPSTFSPPTIGSVRPGVWRSVGGAQLWDLFQADNAHFGARITAVSGPSDPIPTVSRWGLLVLVLVLLGAGMVVIRRSRSDTLPHGRGSLLRAFGALSVTIAWASVASAQVELGLQIRIDVGSGDAAANETSIASSNFNPDEIVAAWNDWREPGKIRMGVGVSNDGGATWTDQLIRPPLAFRSDQEVDPMTAYDDRTGTLWVGAISLSVSANPAALFVARKNPGQNSFQPSRVADSGGTIDKGWMAAGPAPGNPNATNLYIAYTRFVGGIPFGFVVASTNMGFDWATPVDLETQGTGFLPRVGPGGELYVAYWDTGSGVLLKRSFDGGQTFGPPITIATRMDVWPNEDTSRFPGRFRVPTFNHLAVDSNDGTLYCVYFDTTNIVNGNSNVDLYFTKSTDQGANWTTPVIINGDPDPPGDQFFPWIEVDQRGNLHMVFLDSSNTVQNDNALHGMLDAYYSFSNDRGDTWQEYLLTEPPDGPFDSSDDGLVLEGNDQFLGDYLGLARGGRYVYPCYLSTINGDPDIYTHVIEVKAACCIELLLRPGFPICRDETQSQCQQAGGQFFPHKTCPTACPTTQGPTPGP